MNLLITDEHEGGSNKMLASIRPPGGHPGYVVVANGEIHAVCKFYGRACVLAASVGGFVTTPDACAKHGYRRVSQKRLSPSSLEIETQNQP